MAMRIGGYAPYWQKPEPTRSLEHPPRKARGCGVSNLPCLRLQPVQLYSARWATIGIPARRSITEAVLNAGIARSPVGTRVSCSGQLPTTTPPPRPPTLHIGAATARLPGEASPWDPAIAGSHAYGTAHCTTCPTPRAVGTRAVSTRSVAAANMACPRRSVTSPGPNMSSVLCLVGNVVHWFIGSLVHWFIGSLVHWFIGSLLLLWG
jgi:hypothetical protein